MPGPEKLASMWFSAQGLFLICTMALELDLNLEHDPWKQCFDHPSLLEQMFFLPPRTLHHCLIRLDAKHLGQCLPYDSNCFFNVVVNVVVFVSSTPASKAWVLKTGSACGLKPSFLPSC